MMALQKGGRQRSAKTLAPGTGIDKVSAAGGCDNRLYAVIVMPTRAFVNPLCTILHSFARLGRRL